MIKIGFERCDHDYVYFKLKNVWNHVYLLLYVYDMFVDMKLK